MLVVPGVHTVHIAAPADEVEPPAALERHRTAQGAFLIRGCAVDAHVGHLDGRAWRRGGLGRPAAERDLVAHGVGAVGVVAGRGAQLHAAPGTVADHGGEAALPQVLRQDHLDIRTQPLRQREPRRRVADLGDEARILPDEIGGEAVVDAALDAQRVEPQRAPRHAQQVAGEQRHRVGAVQRRIAAEQHGHQVLRRGFRIGRRHTGLQAVERTRQADGDVGSVLLSGHRDAQVGLDGRGVGERDAAGVQAVEPAEQEHLPALAQLGAAGHARAGHRAL